MQPSRMEYPHKTILLNGRRVSIQKIFDGKIEALTPFEKSTLGFIKSWFSGQEKFQFRTSGSTGVPKKISGTRKQLIRHAELTIRKLRLKNRGKILLCIDTRYIGGVMMLVRAFVNEMSIHAIEPTYLKNFKDIPMHIDFAAFVPVQIQSLSKTKGSLRHFNNINNIIVGGAALNPQDARFLSNCNVNVYVTYGMTETFSHVALKRISPMADDYFTALPEISFATDNRSCLVIKVPFLKKKIYTNDIVELLDHHTFKWVGRFDHIINTGGVKVIPEQIESSIRLIAGKNKITNRLYVKGEPDRRLGERVVLVLEGEKLGVIKEGQFLKELKEKLPPYHAPKKIRFMNRFTMVNNKIKRE